MGNRCGASQLLAGKIVNRKKVQHFFVIRAQFARLRAVDDFGAGFTTFKHLRALTVDVVKIDGFFVRNLATNHENQLFIRNLLSLARAFNLVTVAECVENVEDAAVLLREGVNLLQGWYFGKPLVAPAPRAEEETVHGAGLAPAPAPVEHAPEAPTPEVERSVAV